MAQPPPTKRMKLAVPVGAGDGGEAASPTSRRLRNTLLVVLFMVRVSVRTTVPASISQIGGMFQRYVDHAFRKYHEMISGKLETFQGQVESKLETLQGQVESKLETFQGQVEGLRNEVRHLARLCSNRHPDRHTRLEPNQENAYANGSNTNIRLCFLNNLKQPIYTEKNITDENNAAIKVAMFEGDERITSGPLSKAKVEILVLRGEFSNNGHDDWTEEEFDKHIAQGQDGQGLVMGTVRLTNGEVELSQFRFKEGSRRRKFIMGARVCKSEKISVRVQEAIMKPVTVLDRRNEPNEKRYPPRLYDDVYRLEEISINGAYRKRLKDAGILTVQGFLKALNKDSNKLSEILKMEKKRNSWSKMIEHAKTCVLEEQELKRYQNEEGNVVLFFNCVHDLVGGEFPRGYTAREGFSPVEKALVSKWKGQAYNKLEDIPPDYLMEGNIPERISPGTGAAENSPCNEINHVPSDLPITIYDYGISLDDQVLADQGTLPLGQHQVSAPRPLGGVDSVLDSEIGIFQHSFGASTSDQCNLVPPYRPLQLHPMVPAAAPTWTMPAAELYTVHEQGPSCYAFPGPDHANDC